MKKIKERAQKLFWVPALAAATNGPPKLITTEWDIWQWIEYISRVVFYLGLAAVIVFLIIGGIKWITAGGDKEQAEAAKTQITNAVIGLIIIAGAYAIVYLILRLLGGTWVSPWGGPGETPPSP